MPQLAPLNWVLLFCFFWLVLFVVSISFWWLSYNVFNFDLYKKDVVLDNVWMW